MHITQQIYLWLRYSLPYPIILIETKNAQRVTILFLFIVEKVKKKKKNKIRCYNNIS